MLISGKLTENSEVTLSARDGTLSYSVVNITPINTPKSVSMKTKGFEAGDTLNDMELAN